MKRKARISPLIIARSRIRLKNAVAQILCVIALIDGIGENAFAAKKPKPPKPPKITLSVSPVTINEGGTAAFRISASTVNPTTSIAVNYSMSGTAALGTDYLLDGTAGQFTLSPGTSTATVNLTALTDNVSPEASKTAIMTLTAGTGYQLVKTNKKAPKPTVTIVDVVPTPTPGPIITTVAGSGRPFLGNDGPATNAGLGQVSGLGFDSNGNLYVSDLDHQLVVKISSFGTATIFAGNGKHGLSGDGGPATKASLYNPEAIVCDTSNNVYIADTGNSRIRKVSPDGTITTFAGGGTDGFADPVDGVAATSTVIGPSGLAIDSAGNIYTIDLSHLRVRKIRTDRTVVTVAGNGKRGVSGDGGPATSAAIATYGGLQDLCLDTEGNIYIADDNRIRKVDTQGIINTIAGTDSGGESGDGGPAINAAIQRPMSLLFDGSGNLLISTGNVVRRIAPDGIIDTIIGSGVNGFSGDGGPAKEAAFGDGGTWGLAIDKDRNTYVADTGNFRVRKVDTTGTISTFAGNGQTNYFGDDGEATAAGLDKPTSVAFDSNDNMYIADNGNHRVRKVTTGGVITTFAGTGIPGFSGDEGPATAAALNGPNSVAVDSNGNVYISDYRNFRIRKVDLHGTISTYAGNGMPTPCCPVGPIGDGGPAVDAYLSSVASIAVDTVGNLYIADAGSIRLRKVDAGGTITTVAGTGQATYAGDGGPAINASLSNVYIVSVTPDGNLYISSYGSPAQIRTIDPQGIIHLFFGADTDTGVGIQNGDLATKVTVEHPTSVLLDHMGGHYVGSSGYSSIYHVASDQRITYLIGNPTGNGQAGFQGDGGAALGALLDSPGALAADSAGDLYIADTNNDRIRKIWLHGSPSSSP